MDVREVTEVRERGREVVRRLESEVGKQGGGFLLALLSSILLTSLEQSVLSQILGSAQIELEQS